MVDGIQIDSLDSTVLPSTDHVVPAMRDGVTVKLTVGQILALLAPDLSGKFSKEGDTVEGVIKSLLADDEAGIAHRLVGKGRWGGDDPDNGVVVVLGYNASGNRQVVIADEVTGAGVRFLGTRIDAYNYLTNTGGTLTLGKSKVSGRLEVDTTTDGMLPPRLTSTQRDAIVSPVKGLVIYNTDEDDLQVYDGAAWLPVLSVGSDQTWHAVTGSRSAGTDYVNNTGRPMQWSVLLTFSSSGAGTADQKIDGTTIVPWASNGPVGRLPMPSLIVPPGSTYRIDVTGTAAIQTWAEMY